MFLLFETQYVIVIISLSIPVIFYTDSNSSDFQFQYPDQTVCWALRSTKKVTSNLIHFSEHNGRKAMVLCSVCIVKEHIAQQKKKGVFFPIKLN